MWPCVGGRGCQPPCLWTLSSVPLESLWGGPGYWGTGRQQVPGARLSFHEGRCWAGKLDAAGHVSQPSLLDGGPGVRTPPGGTLPADREKAQEARPGGWERGLVVGKRGWGGPSKMGGSTVDEGAGFAGGCSQGLSLKTGRQLGPSAPGLLWPGLRKYPPGCVVHVVHPS